MVIFKIMQNAAKPHNYILSVTDNDGVTTWGSKASNHNSYDLYKSFEEVIAELQSMITLHIAYECPFVIETEIWDKEHHEKAFG